MSDRVFIKFITLEKLDGSLSDAIDYLKKTKKKYKKDYKNLHLESYGGEGYQEQGVYRLWGQKKNQN